MANQSNDTSKSVDGFTSENLVTSRGRRSLASVLLGSSNALRFEGPEMGMMTEIERGDSIESFVDL